jgi:predicted GNAT family acetyltransferase
MQESTQPALRRDAASHRFIIEADGREAGFIDYRDDGKAVRLVHTEISPAFEGRGLASQLVRFALDDVRREGRKVVPSCSYVAGWIAKHPEYQNLVA